MSLSQILKSIYGYIDILQIASSIEVTSWNLQTLNNALGWARYCEQVYKQSVGKPYQQTLAHHVLQIGQAPWGLDNLIVDLNMLQSARNHLENILSSNPYVKQETIKHMNTIGLHYNKPQIIRTKEESRLAQARILIRQIIGFQLCSVQQQTKFRGGVDRKLKVLFSCKEGQVILLTSLSTKADVTMLNVAAVKLTMVAQAQHFILNWLLDNDTIDKQCLFCITDVALQRDVSSKFVTYYTQYLRHLVTCAYDLAPNFDESMHLYFREVSDDQMNYTDIKECFQALTVGKDAVASTTISSLKLLCKSDSTGIWSSLKKEIGVS